VGSGHGEADGLKEGGTVVVDDQGVLGMAEGQNGPLAPVYQADAIHDLHRGRRRRRGRRCVLGLWASDLAAGRERGRYWLYVSTEMENRGVKDPLVVVCEGLIGRTDAGAVWSVGDHADLRARTCSATASATPTGSTSTLLGRRFL